MARAQKTRMFKLKESTVYIILFANKVSKNRVVLSQLVGGAFYTARVGLAPPLPPGGRALRGRAATPTAECA